MAITIIHGDSRANGCAADLILTDPPFDLSGAELADILDGFRADHLVLITTMRQLLGFLRATPWVLHFDFVLDGVMPKKSTSVHVPNYVHQTGVYLTRPGVASVFDRKRRPRSDSFEGNGYWPTIFHAPRRTREHGHGKNEAAITDLLGSFHVKTVVDPFAGSGTTGLAAFELDLGCVLIERDEKHVQHMRDIFKFFGVPA